MQTTTATPKWKPTKLPFSKAPKAAKKRAPVLEAVLFANGRSWRSGVGGINFWEFELKEIVPSEFINKALEIVFVHRVGKEKKLYMFQGISQSSTLNTNKVKFYGLAQVQISKLSELVSDLTR